MSNSYMLIKNGGFVTVSDDELYHYKYIKREKVNGKWRYYYKDDVSMTTIQSKAAVDVHAAAVENSRLAMKEAEKALEDKYGYEYGYEFAINYYNENKEALDKISTYKEYRETIQKALDEKLSKNVEYQKLRDDLKRKTEAYNTAMERYIRKISIRPIKPSENFDSGKSYVHKRIFANK